MPTVTPPPERYSGPFDGQVIERVLPLAEAQKLCAAVGVGQVDGCAGFVMMQDGSRACFIVLPLDGPDPILDHYRRHELGHCAGWPANHSD